MSDDRPKLSTVADPPPHTNDVEAVIEAHATAVLRRWLRSLTRGALKYLAVAGAGAGVTFGVRTTDKADDAPAESQSVGSGPLPVAGQAQPVDPNTAAACEQCRDDARVAIELFGAQIRACGVDELPTPANLPPTSLAPRQAP